MCSYYTPVYIFTCSACEQEGRVQVPHQEENWTDHGLPTHLAVNDAPLVLRCPSCASLQRASGFGHDLDSKHPEAQLPGEADCLEALERGLYEGRDEKLHLRLRAWRTGNDPSRVPGSRAQIRSAEAQANLEALFELLCDDAAEAVTKAEVARQLGAFEESRRLLGSLSRLAQISEPARTIARLAEAGEDGLSTYRLGGPPDEFRCPYCERAGRLSWEWRSFPSHFAAFELHRQHAIRCGACGGAFWRADHVRWAPSRLESFSQGVAAELGCCLFFPLAIAAAFLSQALAGFVLALYVGLILSEGLASIACNFLYPSSRPLEAEDFRDLLATESWAGRDEERWLRVGALDAEEALRPGRALFKVAQIDNARALLELLSEEPVDLMLAAELQVRLGDELAARTLAELAREREPHYEHQVGRFLRELDGEEPEERWVCRR